MNKHDKVMADYSEGRIDYEEYKWQMDLLDLKATTRVAAIFGVIVLGVISAITIYAKGYFGL